MSSIMLSFLEMLMFATTATMLGCLAYQLRKQFQNLTVITSVAVVCGFCSCVMISELEKERIAGTFVIWIAAALYLMMALMILRSTLRKQPVYPGRDAVVEAFDKMDIGICYYEDTGRIILCNEYMHELAMEAEGSRVLNGLEWMESLRSGWDCTDIDGNYEMPLGNRWVSVYTSTIHIDGETLTELIVSDITELKEKQQELENNVVRLAEMNRRLRQYGEIVDTVMREQQILNAKIRIHDRFGELLLMARHAVAEHRPDTELEGIMDEMKHTIAFMESEHEMPVTNPMEELVRTADSIGVTLHITGELPENTKAREITLLAIRECLTNTVKHANGNNLYITMGNNNPFHVEISNDGVQPKDAICFGTGLTALKTKVEKAGGTMDVSVNERYVLTMNL